MDRDLADAMREDKHRSKRGVLDLEGQRERQQLLDGFRQLFRHGTAEQFEDAIRALGLQEESDGFRAAMKLWYSERG